MIYSSGLKENQRLHHVNPFVPTGPGTQNRLLGLWSGEGPMSPDTPTWPPDKDDAQPFTPQCWAWGLAEGQHGGQWGSAVQALVDGHCP